jgi:uncharacterized protein (TIGR02145 family)
MTKNKFKPLLMLLLALFCASFSNAQTYTKGKGLTYKGRSYSTVVMGNGQEWMAENLSVFNFRNGDPIPVAKTEEAWKKAVDNSEPACCYYENNAENGKTYGVLYNWYAVNDPRGIAPEGWHIPTEAEWTTFINYLDPNAVGGDNTPNAAGTKMKSTSGWKSREGEAECANCKSWTPEQKAGQTCNVCKDSHKSKAQITGNGTNLSGFSGLPGGYRFYTGLFNNIGSNGYWWSSTEVNFLGAWSSLLGYDGGSVVRLNQDKAYGLSVRCLRD